MCGCGVLCFGVLQYHTFMAVSMPSLLKESICLQVGPLSISLPESAARRWEIQLHSHSVTRRAWCE